MDRDSDRVYSSNPKLAPMESGICFVSHRTRYTAGTYFLPLQLPLQRQTFGQAAPGGDGTGETGTGRLETGLVPAGVAVLNLPHPAPLMSNDAVDQYA